MINNTIILINTTTPISDAIRNFETSLIRHNGNIIPNPIAYGTVYFTYEYAQNDSAKNCSFDMNSL